MKYIYRIARREFAENAATKGFWIGLLLFPVMILVAIEAQGFLEDQTPTRHFVLIDQSGDFESSLSEGFELEHKKQIMAELQKYVQKHSKRDADTGRTIAESLETPLALMEDLQRFQEENTALLTSVPWEKQLEQYRPYLKEDAPDFEEPKRRFERVSLPEGIDPEASLSEISEALRPYLTGEKSLGDGKELYAAILIPRDVDQHINAPFFGVSLPDQVRPEDLADGLAGGELEPDEASERRGAQYWSSNLADNDLRKVAERIVNDEVRERRYDQQGIDPKKVDEIQRTRMPFRELNPKKAAGKEEVSMADKVRQYAPIAFVYLLWIGIFTISQMLLNNTIEEKSNRIIEVLLSSVTTRELMLGKLFGIAAVGITMLLTWMISLLTILEFKSGPEAEMVNAVLQVLKESDLLPSFAAYFILGYFMYAGLFLIIGSVCNTLKEAQNLMGPVMLIMIVPLITMFFIPKDPNGTLATVLSWIPLYTPFVMMNRAAADPPMFDVLGTGLLLIASMLGVLWMTGKIFRMAILRTGQPPKIMEMLRWLKSSG